jgi:hypothetical protein
MFEFHANGRCRACNADGNHGFEVMGKPSQMVQLFPGQFHLTLNYNGDV